MKKQKGITLIALIISIIVLLILAVVTIGEVRDSKIIGHAQNAATNFNVAQEKEQIGLAVSEWQVEKTISGTNPIFKDVITNALKEQASVDGADEGPLTVTFDKTGNVYTVTEDGEITPVTKGIAITPALTLETGTEGEIAVTATGVDITNLTFLVEPNEIVEVTKGTDGKATVKAGTTVGTATITATCENYTSTCTVTVTEKLTVWERRGAKIKDIFDKVYYNTTVNCEVNSSLGFMFGLCEDKNEGAVWINYSYDSALTTTESIPESFPSSSTIDEMLYPTEEGKNPTAFAFYDGVSFYAYDSRWFTIQYMEGYAKLYKSDTAPTFTETNEEKYLNESSVTYLCELHDTIWEANGLTTSNVTFGATYYDNENWYFQPSTNTDEDKKGLRLRIQEKGSIWYNMGSDSEGTTISAETVIGALQTGVAKCNGDYIIMPFGSY